MAPTEPSEEVPEAGAVAAELAEEFAGQGLVAKLATIMGQLSGLTKRGYNQHHKYAFVRASDVSKATRALLAAANVILQPKVVSHRKDGGLTTIEWNMVFRCGDTGEVLETPWVSEGADTQDKGPNKAATTARKYFLINFFNLETDEDDSDHDGPPSKQSAAKNGHGPKPTPAAAKTANPPANQPAPKQQPPQPGKAPDPREKLEQEIMSIGRAVDGVWEYNGEVDVCNQQVTVANMRARLNAFALEAPEMVGMAEHNGTSVPSLQACTLEQLQWIARRYKDEADFQARETGDAPF